MDTKILASNLLMIFPLYIVWIIGIVLAIVNWKKVPRVSLLVVIAILVMFALAVTSRSLSFLLYKQQAENQLSAANVASFINILNIAFPYANAACWGLLLAAIFGWRRKE